jgi:DNA-binding phage protein
MVGKASKAGKDMPKTHSYQKDLIESLKDPCEAAAYLNAAIEEGNRAVFLLALRKVAVARGGMAALAEKTNHSLRPTDKLFLVYTNPRPFITLRIFAAMVFRIIVLRNSALKIISMADVILRS